MTPPQDLLIQIPHRLWMLLVAVVMDAMAEAVEATTATNPALLSTLRNWVGVASQSLLDGFLVHRMPGCPPP